MAAGGLALLLAYIPPLYAFVLALAALLHNHLILPRYARGLLREDPEEGTVGDRGIILYPAVIAVLILLFARRMEIVAAAWGVLAFGDGAATIGGRLLRGPRLSWNPEKTWSGLVAFLVVGGIAAVFLFGWVHGGLHDITDPVPRLECSISNTWGWWGIPVLIAVLVAAITESLPLGVDDNLSVPLMAAGALHVLLLIDPESWSASRSAVLGALPWAVGLNVALGYAAYDLRVVTRSGFIAGGTLGTAIFAFAGWRAFLLMGLFLIIADGATRLGWETKAAEGIAQDKGGCRDARHAIANCGAAAVLAMLAALSSLGSLATIGMVAALATACADTVASEIGKAYARSTYLITSFRRVLPGRAGGISLSGTLAGIGAGAFIAGVAWGVGVVGTEASWIVLIAAFVGMMAESYLGAMLEEVELIDKDTSNFVNTLIGALAAMAMAGFLEIPA
jgi:uncharacterized protein (TIGR00297 family)